MLENTVINIISYFFLFETILSQVLKYILLFLNLLFKVDLYFISHSQIS